VAHNSEEIRALSPPASGATSLGSAKGTGSPFDARVARNPEESGASPDQGLHVPILRSAS
jgi:hypothetical protein